MSVYQVRGVGEDMEVFEDKLTIKPRGALGLMSKGLKGTKTILFSSITGIQHKKARMTSGYLQFTIPGGNESKRGVFDAASDENTFMFTSKVNDLVLEVKDFIERGIKQARAPNSVGAPSAADELHKLAQLREQGVLSDEEFAEAKRKVLGR